MKLSEQMRGTAARKIRPPAIWSILNEYADKVVQLEAENEQLGTTIDSQQIWHNKLKADLQRPEDAIRHYPDSYLGKIFFQGVECGRKQFEAKSETISDARHAGCP